MPKKHNTLFGKDKHPTQSGISHSSGKNEQLTSSGLTETQHQEIIDDLINNKILEMVNNNDVDGLKTSLETADRITQLTMLDVRGKNDAPLVHLAAKHNSADLIRLLTLYNADIDEIAMDGMKPLHVAAINHSCDVVYSICHSHKSDINSQDDLGNTAAHYAAERNDKETMLILRDFNANFSIPNKANLSPIQLAKKMGHPELASVMELTANKASKQETAATTLSSSAVSEKGLNKHLKETRATLDVSNSIFNVPKDKVTNAEDDPMDPEPFKNRIESRNRK